MKGFLLILCWPLLGFSCAQPITKPHVDPGRYVKTLKDGELVRSYILRVPKGYDNQTNLPLVILLHGWTSNKEQIELYSQFGVKADEERFVLMIPDATEGIGVNKGWNAGFLNLGSAAADDTHFIEQLIDTAEKDLFIDPRRVYVAGHSSGAMMAGLVGTKLSNRIAAIGMVSGTIGFEKDHLGEPKGPVSVILFHGKADNVVPYEGSDRALLKSISAPASAKWWADKDGCAPPVQTKQGDGSVTIDLYKSGKDGSEVEFVSIANGGHMWPLPLGPTKVNATAMMWDFFKSHTKRRQ